MLSTKRRAVAGVLSLFATLFVAQSARATVISYDVTNVHDNVWVYQYAVENDSLGRPIDLLSIYFDLGLRDAVMHSGFEVLGAPDGWGMAMHAPDPNLADDGYLDVIAPRSGGLAPGLLLDGFRLQFAWLGAGVPPAQRFEILSLEPFDVIESGVTRPGRPVVEPPPVAVVESSVSWLLTLALSLFAIAGAPRIARNRS